MKGIKKQIFQYTALFEEDAKQGGYTATIPELPGCISEGDTFEDALRNIQEAAILYLEMAGEKHFYSSKNRHRRFILAPIDVVV